jgi:hypothetical protein
VHEVKESSDVGGWCLWGFAIVWNLFSLPLWFLVDWELPVDAKKILFAAFPLVGVLLILGALYQTLRRHKYGTSLCRIEQEPIALGATCRGEIEVRLREMPASGFALRLACVRRTFSGSGKNRSMHESILWQDDQTVAHGPMPSPHGMRVPFRFDIPWDCEPTDLTNREDSVIWKLEASAEVPGIDYKASFDLPVFRTEGGRDELGPRVHSALAWQPPREITVGSDTIVIRSGSRITDWIFVLVFFSLWFGALALIRQFGAPLAIVLFFGAIGAFVALLIVDRLLGRTTLTATRTALTTRRTWLGLGRRITIPATEITRLETRIGTTFGNTAFHDVRAVLHDGRKRTVARHIRIRSDAEMLAERLAQGLGL